MLITFFGKMLFYVLLITFKAKMFRRKNQPLFVDFNEMHLLTKFHADQRSSKGRAVKKAIFSAI